MKTNESLPEHRCLHPGQQAGARIETGRRTRVILATGLCLFLLMFCTLRSTSGAPLLPLDFTPTAYVYLPHVANYPTPTPTATAYACPTTSSIPYAGGVALQFDKDNPVRPAYNHADKNIELRGYTLNTDPGLKRELVNYGSDDPNQPPQLATLFETYRVPTLINFYRVHHWLWANPPNPGTRGDVITAPPVTALGMETTPGESLHVPISDYDIGQGMEVLVLFADQDTVALRYTREDSSGSQGYTVHVDNICTDPSLLALYDQLDAPNGPRYIYPNPSYNLPNMPAGYPFGTARDTEIVVAISDTGAFQDPRSCNEWWQVRPGYTGSCPPP